MPVRVAILGRPMEPLAYLGDQSLKRGDLLRVPLGSVTASGCVVSEEPQEREGLKHVEELLVPGLFPESILRLAEHMAAQQAGFVGEALGLALPKEILMPPRKETEIGESRTIVRAVRMRPDEIRLLAEIEPLKGGILIHSTADYTATLVELLSRVAKKGRQALLILPHEPSLARCYERLHPFLDIALYHSGMSQRERRHTWHGVRLGKLPLVAGLRSAVFLPFTNLGLIVVTDEDSDAHRERTHHLHYNARDLALFRGREENFPVVLFSLAPALETAYASRSGKLRRIERRVRQQGKALIVDMHQKPVDKVISDVLMGEIEITLERGMQTVLVLNRLGSAARVVCLDCGNIINCSTCGIPLKFLKPGENLVCPICSRKVLSPDRCPSCGGERWQSMFPGLEVLRRELRRNFAGAGLCEITGERRPLMEEADESDIIYGTSAVLEYLPRKVELTAFLSWDAERLRPDFRSSERAFRDVAYLRRILVSASNSRLLIQTFRPRDVLLGWALRGEYERFFQSETRRRRELGYPPYRRLLLFERRTAKSWEPERLIERISKEGVEILGPYSGRKGKSSILVKLRRDLQPCDLIDARGLLDSGWQLETDPAEIL